MNAPYEPEEFAVVPPNSIDAEQAVLGGLLLDNEAIDRIGDLRRDQFYVHANGAVFECIQRLITQQKPADVLTVFDALKAAGKETELGHLNSLVTETPSAANIGRYAEIVREKSLLRGMLKAADKVQEIVSGTLAPAEKLDAAQAEFGKLAESTTRRESASIRDALKRYVDDLDRRARGEAKNPGIPTGLVDLDNILNGGIRRGALVTIGARPGMGKSALGETIALNAAIAGFGVLFLSMEMPESEVTERAIANVGQISVATLARADKSMNQLGGWNHVTRASQVLQETNLHIDDEPGLSVLQVMSKARAVKRRHGLDLLVVDYLQLMVGTKEKRHEQIEEITRNLKILAKTLNVAILALSQFSREIEKRPAKRPILSDFRDGGSIEQDSDILMGLYREEQDNPDTDNKGYAELFVMKNRQGRPGRISLTYLGEQMRFENFAGDALAFRTIKPRHQGFKD